MWVACSVKATKENRDVKLLRGVGISFAFISFSILDMLSRSLMCVVVLMLMLLVMFDVPAPPAVPEKQTRSNQMQQSNKV